ncbi:MAG: DNA polymerase III subunit gamma/tau [Candidatus Pacebacteria bacterium]|nr:DNA polymerase III subunit gamma/tau [Candidatus Paceibacterota bacterium]
MKEETTLYRKYRPQNFKEIIGQDHIVDTLQSALKLGNFAHAYLFSGSRGIGKTSIARILAGELGTTANDMHEIDAASNRGIDDIRELREAVRTLPFESKYKVYIIDEVHMLTKEAFNALLKTLEEPPEHVVFILATTEAEKLPATIVSRCQTFTFKKPTQVILKDAALAIAKKEGYTLDKSAAELIAVLGDGSFRDTIGMVQKVMSTSADKKITAEEVEAITGAPRSALIDSVITAIAENDIEKVLATVHKAAEGNINMKMFVKLILAKLRFILLLRFAKSMESTIKDEVDKDDFEFLKKMSDPKNTAISSKTVLVLLEAYTKLDLAYVAHLPLELALIEMMEDKKG